MIHKYSLFDRYILLDVPSGAVHEIDVDTYQLLDTIKPPMQAAAPDTLNAVQREIWDELYQLQQSGLLFTQDMAVPPMPEQTPLKAMCLHVAHDCNLRCSYCFAGTGDFGGGRGLMPPEVGKRAIDYLLARCASRHNLEIDFFGGEPLMALDTVKQVVEYARQTAPDKNFRFTITTNGLLLNDDSIEYINREMNNVVLSLDGRQEVHDALRKTVSGDGSYRHIIPKYQKLLDTRKGDYFVRGTFTAQNLDFVQDVLQMERDGFQNLSIEPVVLPSGHELSLTREHLPVLLKEYDHLLEKMIEGRNFDFFHFQIDLEQGPCLYKRTRGCGAGYEYVAVTPEGDLYPCHQFVGQETYKLGSVLDDSWNREMSGIFKGLSIDTRDECRECWAKYYCSGGCSASNLTAEGDINTCYRLGCELERKRVECAIYLNVIGRDENR